MYKILYITAHRGKEGIKILQRRGAPANNLIFSSLQTEYDCHLRFCSPPGPSWGFLAQFMKMLKIENFAKNTLLKNKLRCFLKSNILKKILKTKLYLILINTLIYGQKTQNIFFFNLQKKLIFEEPCALRFVQGF